MGEAARARVLERFTWDRVVLRCLEAYEGARCSTEPRRCSPLPQREGRPRHGLTAIRPV